jgi:integrase
MKAWLFQDSRQKKKLGDAAPWSVGWLDPDGKRKSKSLGSLSKAQKYQRRVEGELAAGTYRGEARKKWDEFKKEYTEKIANGMDPQTKRLTMDALKHFERLAKPGRVASIKTSTIDGFIAKRRTERGRKEDTTVSPATINKELRHLKTVLRIAHDWGYLPQMPKIRMVKGHEKAFRFVTPEHFAAIYEACKVATRPTGDTYTAADWWRALLVYGYLSGWRVHEILSLRWDDVSLDQAYAVTRYQDNKGRREERVPLHTITVEHLRKLVDFSSPLVFPWPLSDRRLWTDFAVIQKAAGIELPCRENHEKHTDACHLYGFHDLRRAFATQNVDQLSARALQALMRHKSFSTTQRYIDKARKLDQAVKSIFVPEFLKQEPGQNAQ